MNEIQNVIEERPDLPWREAAWEEELRGEGAAHVPGRVGVAAPVVSQPRTAPAPEPVSKEEEERREALLRNVRSDYKVVGVEFRFRDRPAEVAFKDAGKKLTTSHNAPEVALSMVALAEAKGWTSIALSGHAEFRREVWLEARLRGIAVTGFEPKPQDKDELARRLDARMTNSITAGRAIGAVAVDRPRPTEATKETLPRSPQPPPPGKEGAFAEAMRLMTTSPDAAVRVSKEGVEVAEKMLKGERIPVGDEERRRIVKAVAQVAAERKGASPEVVKQVVAQVERVIDRRVAEGRGVPAVPVYDKSAPAKKEEEVQPTQHNSRAR